MFNENRNLIEFNSDQDFNLRNRNNKDSYDEKIFDEKLYEDLFHQIVSDPVPQPATSLTTSNSSLNNKKNTLGNIYFEKFILNQDLF